MGWRPDDPIYLHQIIKTQLIINLTVYQFISSKFTTQTTIDYPLWFFLKMIFLTNWVILCWNTLSERVTDICYNTIASTCLRSQWQWLLWWWWWWWWWLREWWPPLALTETQQPIGARLKTYQRPDQPRYYYNCNVACYYGDDKGDYDNLKHTACTSLPPGHHIMTPTNTSFTAYLASNYDSSWHSITLLIDTYNTNTSWLHLGRMYLLEVGCSVLQVVKKY